MDSLTLLLSTPTTANNLSAFKFVSSTTPLLRSKSRRIISFTKPRRQVLVLASSKDANEDPTKLDEWDRMELKLGRMIGEDPKITLAKIMGRKLNPDMSYLEIEKLLDKKGKASTDEIEEVPFDLFEEKKSTKSYQGLNLVRPVPKKGTKFETTDKPVERDDRSPVRSTVQAKREIKSSVPNVILRKPSSFNEDDGGIGKSSRFGMKPNLSLKMGKEQLKERFSDITLLKKPEPVIAKPDIGVRSNSGDDKAEIMNKQADYRPASSERSGDAILLQKPELVKINLNKEEEQEYLKDNIVAENNLDVSTRDSLETRQTDSGLSKGSATELQADMGSGGRTIPMATVLVGKPKRLDLSSRGTEQNVKEGVLMNPGSSRDPLELENFLATSPIKEREEDDWARSEKLVETGERVEVELISSSTRGFVVSFGSLIGFLPYRNLAARWKFLAFESWLRRKGLDPSIYRQNLGIIGKYDANSMTDTSESGIGSEIDCKPDEEVSSDMKLEDLLMIYDQEKLKFLSSFVGQKIKVGVVLADRISRKLIFSIRQKEKEELVERKKSLMATLSVGDVVKCCIKKITYFGIFVEVEGVPALIHQTEVSWDATLDPASYFKVGQIVEAKVHQLDFSLGRIFLSLKEITPDPLIEALEAVVGDHDSLAGGLEAAQADTEWADVEILIRELELFDGIQSVSKGRYFLSPGLAPSFQVYMASMFENQYKLLARAGNRVQEIIVQASIGKEELKSAIMTCTNRVE